MGSGLGVNSLLNVLKMPENKSVIRLDSDVRSSQLNSQRMVEIAGSIPYGFIPNYNNYADKRCYDPACGVPFTQGRKESVIMYVAPLGDFWTIRSHNVVLFDNGDIKSFYEAVKTLNPKMEKDKVSYHPVAPKLFQGKFELEVDYYKGTVLLFGYMSLKEISKILNGYAKWNVIEWRIPTTKEGIYSQKAAIKKKFILSGYDPGSYKIEDGQLVDTLVMCMFPNGMELTQFECFDLSQKNTFIVSKVIHQLAKYYPACKKYE
jgi:hypothetical protein